MEVALNNHEARTHFKRWIKTLARNFDSLALAQSSCLSWMEERELKIATLRLPVKVYERAFKSFLHCNLEADAIECKMGDHLFTVDFVAAFREVHKIHVSACDHGHPAAWEQILQKNPNLHTLVLTGPSKHYDMNPLFAAAARYCSLVKLHVNHCSGLRDTTAIVMAQRFQRLQNLTLFGCDAITDSTLIALAQHCRKLRTLKLSASQGCTSMSAVVNMLSQCSQLREVCLWDCSGPNATAKVPAVVTGSTPIGAQLITFDLQRCILLR